MKNILVGLLVFTLVFGVFSVVGLAQGGHNGNGGPGPNGNNARVKGNGNGDCNGNGIQERDKEQAHIDDPLYQNNEFLNEIELNNEEMEEFNQLKEEHIDEVEKLVE